MKKFNFILFFMLLTLSLHAKPIAKVIGNWEYSKKGTDIKSLTIQQVSLSSNNISSFFINSGIFDQNRLASNSPGFEWPIGSNHDACFTAGLSIGTKIEGILKEASCSYIGEYGPGYIDNSGGIPIAITNSDFKLYKILSTDNAGSNPDYANWYKMVPYGAPYIDLNNNGQYDNGIDKPGIKNSSSTIFACLTDGFPANHFSAEGFGGGTSPIFCEMHLTAWAYNTGGMEDVQFIKWTLINKNINTWDSLYLGIVADPDLGNGGDDYIGCDTLKNLGYCYNADNNDDPDIHSYGANPPAFGIDILKGPENKIITPSQTIGLTSFDFFSNLSSGGPACETDPNPNAAGAYNYLRGYKLDGSPWLNPATLSSQSLPLTKFCYPGDPEQNTGWTERTGSVHNCNGVVGPVIGVNPPGDRRFVMGMGKDDFQMNSNDTQSVVIAQMVARGTNNFNSVTKLKQLDAAVKSFYAANVPVNHISSEISNSFTLSQNYPNPFNPDTKISYSLNHSGEVSLKVYDAEGKYIETLKNGFSEAGTYSVKWNGSDYSSGIYFYVLQTSTGFTETKKMLLIK